MLTLRFALRELRGGGRGFLLLITGIALCTAVIAMIGLLSAAVLDGMRESARNSLGGDVSLRLFHRAPEPKHVAAFDAVGTLSQTAEIRVLARRGSLSSLVELKAVDEAYPLYGTLQLTPPLYKSDALARRGGVWGAAVSERMLSTLDTKLGDIVTVGKHRFELRALIVNEPDRSLRAITLGPRMIVGLPALTGSSLLAPGSQAYWYQRIRFRQDVDVDEWIEGFERAIPNRIYRIVNAASGVPGAERTLALITTLLTFAAMGILLVSCIGLANGVSAWLDSKRFNIAILKSLGAPGHFILQIYLAQVAGAAAIGVTIGLAAGMVCLPIIVSAIGDWTPISVSPDARALLIACGFSFLTTLLYTLLPLTRAEVMRPHILFRADVTWPAAPRLRRRIVALIAIAAALAGLFLWSTPLPFVASLFAVGAALVVVALFGFSRLVSILARITGRLSALERLPLLRLALSNIHRKGASTAPLLMAVGLCLILTIAVESLRQNVAHHLAATLPAAAPGLIVLNIDPAEGQRFDALMAAAPQVNRWERAPFLHARIIRINGRAVTANRIPADVAYAVRGDRGISWWPQPHPTRSEIVDGSWWPDGYSGAPLASVDARVARRLGIGVGDTLTLDLPSKPLQTKIANLRYVDRTKLNLDFPILLSPFADPPPYREIAPIWTGSAASHDALRTLVSREFPEAPSLLVSEVTAFLVKITARIGRAFHGISAITGLAAFLVLIGIVAATSQQRVDEAILLKVVGATRLQTLAVTLIEFAIIGASPALAALLIGNLAAWVLIGGLIEFRPAVSSVLPWLITGALLPAVVSLLVMRCALTRRAAASLRRA